MKRILFITLLFLFGCDDLTNKIDGILYPDECSGIVDECGVCDGDGTSCDEPSTDGGIDFYSDLVISNIEYNINSPYGYAQLDIQITNNGNIPSGGLLKPCLTWEYTTGGVVGMEFEYNYSSIIISH